MTRGLTAALLFGLLQVPSWAVDPTTGGRNGRVLTVTSLANAGPGTLREALETGGAREIRFDVAGEIWLKDALRIKEPFVTVAGESAPPPGISLMGDGIRIQANDVILRHLRVRVGALLTGSAPQNRDGISVGGAARVLVENCSVAWAQDENMEIWGKDNRDIVIRHCLIAEGLRHSLHPKGGHSAGLIVGPGAERYLLQGNLFASNGFRNPGVTSDTTGFIVNNLVYNPGSYAIHVYGRDGLLSDTRLVVGILGNRVIAGPDTKSDLGLFQKKLLNPGSQIFLSDNLETGVAALDAVSLPPGWPKDWASPFVREIPMALPAGVAVLPVGEVEDSVLAQCGARPLDRDETDNRIIGEVANRTGGLADVPADPRLVARMPEDFPAQLRKYARLLGIYASSKGIHFAAWRSNAVDRHALKEILEFLTVRESPDLATAINAHNVAVLNGLIESGQDGYSSLPDIFLAGKPQNVEAFAAEIKERFPDPRVPFALYEGTRGGPSLHREPFWQPFIQTQLDQVVGNFVNDKRGVAEKGNHLWISPVFQREQERFPEGTIAFIKKYSGKYPRATQIHYIAPDNARDKAE